MKKIGIDIGATKINIGLVEDSKVLERIKFDTPSDQSKKFVMDSIVAGISQLWCEDIQGIGIGVPGLVDEENGIVYDLVNIPAWDEVCLKHYLENQFKKPVKITNDANIFVLGEKKFGKGKDFKNLVGITLGSGFGTGIVIDNSIYSGTLSSAGEVGSTHI